MPKNLAKLLKVTGIHNTSQCEFVRLFLKNKVIYLELFKVCIYRKIRKMV